MRHSRIIQALGSKTDAAASRAKRRGAPLLSALLSGCVAGLMSQSAMSQTPTPAVYSVLTDTAMQGEEKTDEPVKANVYSKDDSYTALASNGGAVTSRASDLNLSLGASDEGTIVSISEGEDRVIGEVPAGDLISTSGNPVYEPGLGMSSMPSSYMEGGAYSGYASSGYANTNPCCPENCHSYYVGYESIYITRKADESFTLSQYTSSQRNYLGTFDFEFGGRYTLGQMLDCTDGVEFVYTGQLNWNRGRVDNSPAGNLDSILVGSGGYIASQIDTFNGAIRHIQLEEVELQSFEANRRWFAWDIMSTLIGIRAFDYNERFLFDSVDQDLGAGFFRNSTRNFLLGGQIGADMYRPIGQRLSIGTRTRLGVFANFHEGATSLANRGVYLLYAQDKDTDIAGVLQYSANIRYKVGKHITVVGGYDAWILGGMSTVSDQQYVPITPDTGLGYQSSDMVFFHGATGGLEITF